MTAFRILLLLILVLAPATRAGASEIDHVPEIEVAGGDWGSATREDIRSVLRSTAAALLANGLSAPGAIRVVPSADGPRVRFERGPRGEHVVELSARDRHWARFAYQFSHELCHIVSHFDEKEVRGGQIIAPNQWFEETLCEAAALTTLQRLATDWETNPPYPRWRGYAPAFREYAEALLAEKHRELPEKTSVAAWYEDNAAALRDQPYHRERNELVANALLPLFDSTPGNWESLAYLNRDRRAASGSLADYLESWRLAAPRRHQPLIEAVAALITPAR